MEAKLYNQKAEEVGQIKLSKEVFDLPWNDDLIHQVVYSMKSNARNVVAHAKGRGEVAGTGKKPWRQKGTGRARHGSRRSPIWVGGGVTHGPTKEKNYSKKINKKMKVKAMLVAFSQKMRDNEILFMDKLVIAKPKTKEASSILNKISKLENFSRLAGKSKNKAVIAITKKDVELQKSFRNIPGTKVELFSNLNILDLVNFKYLILADAENAVKSLKK